MRWDINSKIPFNSFEYFDKTLITENGFREYDVRWILGKEINPNGFVVLGKAYGTMMQRMLNENTVVVGHDFRSYSQDLVRSLIVGLLSTGVRVIDLGMTLSPMMYYAQHHFNCKAGLQVTASHNENGWTGIKIADGLSSTLGPEGINKFKEYVYSEDFQTGKGSYESYDNIFEDYKKDLLKNKNLKKKIKVVVAAGNGTAGSFAPGVLRELGCEVIELDCNPDWNFSKYNPNPEDIAFLEYIREATVSEQADIGIGIDGDGDRIGVVDDEGNEIFADKVGLILAKWISRDHPDRKVVIDVKSTGLYFREKQLLDSNTEVVLWKTGHSYIKSKVAEVNAIAGFEKSGHLFFNEPYGKGYDDALQSSIHLICMLDQLGKSLSSLIKELPKSWQSPTLGVYCPDESKYDVVETVTRLYQADKENGIKIGANLIKDLVTINGVRFVLQDDSWGLIRASSNKPSLVLVAESNTSRDQLYDIMEHIQKRLAETGQIGEYDQQMPPR